MQQMNSLSEKFIQKNTDNESECLRERQIERETNRKKDRDRKRERETRDREERWKDIERGETNV